MSVDAIACGEFANESERTALESLLQKLRSLQSPQRWLLLTNLASAVNDRAIPDEIDLVAIGTTGLFIIEIKHWDRGFLKLRPNEVQHEADIRRIANVRNLQLQSPPADRFHRIYRGEHVRSRDKVILHLYDVSASTDTKADRIASREFDALQKLQQLPCVPRLMDSFHEVPDYSDELESIA